MKRKRTSVDDEGDGQMTNNEDVDSQHKDGPPAKRRHLNPPTTIYEMPVEILQKIMVQAVLSEVRDRKLSKSIWKETAEEILQRLGDVSSFWSEVASTTYIVQTIHHSLDETVEGRIGLEVVQQAPVTLFMEDMATIGDEVYTLYSPTGQHYSIFVYSRDNLTAVNRIISLDDVEEPYAIAAGGSVKDLYLLNQINIRGRPTVYSILKVSTGNRTDAIVPWIADLSLDHPRMSVSVNGNLLLTSGDNVNIYDVSGTLTYTISLTSAVLGVRDLHEVLGNKRGNLLLVTHEGDQRIIVVLELQLETKTIIRQHKSRLQGDAEVFTIDNCERLVICNSQGNCEFLDCQLNTIENSDPLPLLAGFEFPACVHFNSERNEIVRLPRDHFQNPASFLTIYRLAEH